MTSTDDARGELLACPFCGGKAHDVGPYGEGLFAVRCDQCGGGVSGFDQCRQDAIDAWNTRAAPVPQCDAESVRVAAREALDRYGNHDVDCVAEIWHGKGPMRCSCGFFEAIVSPPSEAGREGIEILENLADSIRKHGNYSSEATITFIDQALQCFRDGCALRDQGTVAVSSANRGGEA